MREWPHTLRLFSITGNSSRFVKSYFIRYNKLYLSKVCNSVNFDRYHIPLFPSLIPMQPLIYFPSLWSNLQYLELHTNGIIQYLIAVDL